MTQEINIRRNVLPSRITHFTFGNAFRFHPESHARERVFFEPNSEPEPESEHVSKPAKGGVTSSGVILYEIKFDDQESFECPISLEKPKKGDIIAFLPRCGHKFIHNDRLLLDYKCPMCRSST
jgi:hypothetical protein